MQWNEPVILLVDDEPQILVSSRLTLAGGGIGNRIETLNDSRGVPAFLERENVAAIVLDLFMPHVTGLELLPLIVREHPGIPVIVMTALDEAGTAVEAMKAGAFDYLVKPVESERLVSTVKKALEMGHLSREVSSLKECLFSDDLRHPEAFAGIAAASKQMRAVFQYVEVVGPSRQPVLIMGETGVGKELVANAVHTVSGFTGPFVPVNVAGLDDVMFSDTLFGHRKGAYTGADSNREGLIARATGGTLFLDEIGDLNETSQIKLLRLLQEGEYYPVGSDTARRSDARIVCATNRDLQEMMGKGGFRKDLYYRLCAHQVRIPPLRERLDDIPPLLEFFLAEGAKAFGKKKPTPPPEMVTLLSLYNFPGNVREMQALVYDAVARHAAGVLSMETIREAIGEDRASLVPPSAGAAAEGEPMTKIFGRFPTIRDVEDYLIAEAMKLARGNQGMAAGLLGITRQTLNKRLRVGGSTEGA
jgi:two-component system, NtrC family, response regulator HydG